MVKFFKIILFLVVVQTNGQESLVSAGSNANGTGGSLSFTIAQTIYTTNFSSSGSVSQGVQQPYEIQTVLGENNFEIKLELKVYPNPTSDILNLYVKNYNSDSIQYQLFDLNGRLIISDRIYNETTSFSMQNLPSSVYILKVLSSSNVEIKTFNIIKK